MDWLMIGGAIMIVLVILVGVGLIANENAKQVSKQPVNWVSFEDGNVLVDEEEVDWSAAVSQVDEQDTQPIMPDWDNPIEAPMSPPLQLKSLQATIDRWHKERG